MKRLTGVALLVVLALACGRSDLGEPDIVDAQPGEDGALPDGAIPDAPIDRTLDDHAVPSDAGADAADSLVLDAPADVEIPDAGPPLNAIAVGSQRGCVVQKTGAVKCWGHAILGDGTPNDSLSAVPVVGLPAPAIKVSMGTYVTCVRLQDDSAWCWGSSVNSMLGAQKATYLSPVAMQALGHTVVDIAVGSHHACAVVLSGGVKCWGEGYDGELGNNQTLPSIAPVDVLGLVDKATAVSVGGVFGCALLVTGQVQCWGQNNSGQLGDGTETSSWTAAKPVPGITSVVGIATGGGHVCAVTAAGAMKCWGDDAYGELGDNSFDGGDDPVSLVPVDVIGLGVGVTAVTAHNSSTCAVLSAGSVKCWGHNYSGQLGDGTTTDRHTPADVINVQSNAVAAAMGSLGACALMSNGRAKCWGYYGFNGPDAGSTTAVDVPGLP